MSLFHSAPPAVPGFLKEDRQFALGAVTVSVAAQEALHSARLSLESLLARHTARDYGEIGESDSYNLETEVRRGFWLRIRLRRTLAFLRRWFLENLARLVNRARS